MAPISSDVTDLNAILPARRRVLFGTTTYEVPGDMPMEVYLRTQLAFAADDEQESTAQLQQAFIDLLSFYTPDNQAVRDQIREDLRPVSVRTIIQLFNVIYKSNEDEDAKEDAEGKASSTAAPTTVAATPTTTGTSSSESSPTLNLEEVGNATTTG